MIEQKVYVKNPEEVVIACPHCGLTRKANIRRHPESLKRAKVRCKCGKSFVVAFEYRQHYRKATELKGSCVVGSNTYGMTVKSLSLGGLGGVTSAYRKLKEGDMVEVEVVLDDHRRSRIRALCVVRQVGDHFLGVQFQDMDQESKRQLGFYLMP